MKIKSSGVRAPAGVSVVSVRGEPEETRRVVLAHLPGPLDGPAARVAGALITAARTPGVQPGARSCGRSEHRRRE